MNSGRVPSYKAIALAILKNDIGLIGLGFEAKESKFYADIIRAKMLSEAVNEDGLFK